MAATSRAVICIGKGEAAVKEVPVPSLQEGHVLVEVKALGLNPTDWKSIYSGDATGARIGVCTSPPVPQWAWPSLRETLGP